jgi:hypothetical protein
MTEAQLDHRNICRMYDFGERDGVQLISMAS